MPKLRMPTLPMKTLRNSSVEECAKSCAQETSFDCRSFDVDNILQTCRLHNHSLEDHTLSLIVSKNTDHYRSKKVFTNYPLSCRSYFRTITIKWLRYTSFYHLQCRAIVIRTHMGQLQNKFVLPWVQKYLSIKTSKSKFFSRIWIRSLMWVKYIH